MIGTHESVRYVAELTVDLRDPVKEVRGFVRSAVRRKTAGKIVDLGK
ncbi:MAG TPA: hypothetical protein VM692_13425 [Gammaproteobacteria bacterium]|nr:hypothetical protein [Gammaproteobacteria bacterium]